MSKQTSNLVNASGNVVASIVNPWGVVTLSEVTGERYTNPATRYGGPSTKLASFVLPINVIGGIGLNVNGSVYAELKTDDGKLKIRVSLPKGITSTKQHTDAIKAYVNDALLSWPMFRKAAKEAHTAITNPVAKQTSKDGKSTAAPLEYDPLADEAAA